MCPRVIPRHTLIRHCLVVIVCSALLLSSLVPPRVRGETWSWLHQGTHAVQPEVRIQAVGLPDLETAKNPQPEPQTPPAQASSIRSRHNPIVPEMGAVSAIPGPIRRLSAGSRIMRPVRETDVASHAFAALRRSIRSEFFPVGALAAAECERTDLLE